MKRTDWDRYYTRPYRTAALFRKLTERILHRLINDYSPQVQHALRIGELGGANSCFFEGIRKRIKPAEYHIIDNNQIGLDEFRKRVAVDSNVMIYNDDVLQMRRELALDIVFSVGLIEHFSPQDTRKAVRAHFQILKPDGIAIITFPTPTLLYRATRRLSEALGLWIFHDERPLYRGEVADAIAGIGTIVFEKTIWSIILTQRIMVIRNST